MSSLKNIVSELRIWLCNFVIAFIPFHFIRLSYYKYVMGFQIGKGSSIHLGCHFTTTRLFVMEQNSTINQFCHIDNRGGITIGNNVSISPKVSFVSADHDMESSGCDGRKEKIIIEDYVFIGFDAIILKDCILQQGSVLGARSLLTSNTEPYGMYFGAPAKMKKTRNNDLTYNASYKRLFH